MKRQSVPIFCFCLLVIGFGLPSCAKQEAPVRDINLPDSVMSVFESIETRFSDEGSMKVVLKAPKHIRYLSQNEVYPDGFELVLYDDFGRKSTVIEADYGAYDRKNNQYAAYGSVLVKNMNQKQELQTDTLYWDQKKEEIFTPSRVQILTESERLTGKGLRAKQDFSRYKILRPLGVFTLKD